MKQWLAKKAILMSDKVGCVVDLIKNNENGFIFKSNNLDDLKEKIKFLKIIIAILAKNHLK